MPRPGVPNVLSDSRMRVSWSAAIPLPARAKMRVSDALRERLGLDYSAPNPSTPRMRSMRRRTPTPGARIHCPDGPEANHELTFNMDQLAGADQFDLKRILLLF